MAEKKVHDTANVDVMNVKAQKQELNCQKKFLKKLSNNSLNGNRSRKGIKQLYKIMSNFQE